MTAQFEVDGSSYFGFYDFANNKPKLLDSALDLGLHGKNSEDLGIEIAGHTVLELPLESPLDILVLGLKPESPIYFWSSPELGITTVCDSKGRSVDQLLRK